MNQVRPSIISELRYRHYEPLEISALSGKILSVYFVIKYFSGHKCSDSRIDITYTTISDKCKMEMTMSIYQYARPNVILPDNLLDIIWNQAHRLRQVYNGYNREVSFLSF